MAWWWWLICGILIGWLIEWVIDWLYWRRRLGELREAHAKLEAENEVMHGERDQHALNLRTARAENERVQTSVNGLRGEFDQSQELAATLRAEIEQAKGESSKLRAENDRLSHDLATALTETRSLGSLRDERNQLQAKLATNATERERLEHDLAALRSSAGEHEQEAGSLRARLAELMAAGAARTESGIGKLTDSDKGLFASATEETPELGFSHGGEVVADDATPDVKPSEPTTTPHVSATLSGEPQTILAATTNDTTAYRDTLVDIDGISPVYEQRLFAAGITSFNQLAALTADQVRQIVEPDRWHDFELATGEAWIAEARQRATTQPLYIQSTRDPLIDIDGIGPVYEQKLFAAGVTTFDRLAKMTPDEVQAIIKPEAWQHVDFAGWIAEAGEFAARHGGERNS